MKNSLVLIVGAGPTGMTAAIELGRFGFDVRIVDRSEHLAEHSQALGVQARTLEQFQRYAIADIAVERGRKVTRAEFWSEGKKILSLPLSHISSVYPFILLLPQSETEAILNRHMEWLGIRPERGTELVDLSQHDDAVTAILRNSNGDREEIHPRWVIGCDGAHSLIRQKLGIPFEGASIGMSFFLGDVQLDGPDAPTDQLSVHFHHGDVVFLARLTDKLFRIIVASHAMQQSPLQKEVDLRHFQLALDAAGINAKAHSPEWMTPFHVNDRHARHYRVGNVFLAGDASHIHSPVGGQGMNTGIQDVANLAWKMAAVTRGADIHLLNSYESERGEVGKALLRFTERGLKLGSTTSSVLESMRDTFLPVLSALKPVQRAMLGFISETAIEYRSSWTVMDFGGDGDLRAGDRLLDFELKPNSERPMLQKRTLLQDWTEPKHLALLLEPTGAEVNELRQTLPQAVVITVRAAELDRDGLRALGTSKKLLIVRPDGYIGFRGHAEPHTPWMEYAEQDGILAPSLMTR
ncbi:MAG TPA: FAD-dependent monooxygenase [Terracidiphilus sp.]|nr:FAD-dependent monooxygenase [Terracidiphilus sp.]